MRTNNEAAFRHQIEHDLRGVIDHQYRAEIDIAGDGELPRIGFSFYVKDRMSGFGGVAKRGTVTDFAKFPDFAALKLASGSKLAKVRRFIRHRSALRESNTIHAKRQRVRSWMRSHKPSNLGCAIPRDLRHSRNSRHHLDHSTTLCGKDHLTPATAIICSHSPMNCARSMS